MRALFTATCLLALMASAPALAQAPLPAAAAPDAGPGPVPQGRLSDAVVPTAYRVALRLDPAQPRFSGHIEIDATLKAPSRFIYLDGRDLAVSAATAKAGGQTVTASYSQVDPSGVALLTFPAPLPAGAVTLGFDYSAAYNDGPQGLFRVQVGDNWYGWSQFESSDARAAFPGFDQPGFKQPFTITIDTPAGMTAVSNAPETSIDHAGARDIHHFAPTLPLPTYLLALMSGPFAITTTTIPPTPQRPTALPLRLISTQQNAAKLAFAAANTKPIIAGLEDYFGQSFPYPKLDEITAPIMPGAMENAGADLYEDSLLVLDNAAPPRQKREFGMVVSHELAHQWFGDLVTPTWWDDVWLNESFANWMGYRIGNLWRPDLHIGAGALAEAFAAMKIDSLVAGRPIHQPISRTAQIDAAFDSITYGKGGQVVAMIAAYIGDDKFREGVRHYMALHRYGNATSADFFAAMADVAGDARLLPAMQSFTDQQGVPLLTFEIDRSQKGMLTYSASQSRYARIGTQAPDTRWIVPMCVRVNAARACSLNSVNEAIATASQGVDTASALVVPNAGGTGYFRFELPAPEWDHLIAASATLPAGEALALSDSLLASFQAGRAHITQLADLARVMSANPDSHAASAATEPLTALTDSGLLAPAAVAAAHHFLGRLAAPRLAKLGFDPRRGAYALDDPDQAQARSDLVTLLAGTVRDAALNARLRGAAKAMLAGDANALDPAWYGDAFAALIAEGGLAAAKPLLDRALTSEDASFRPAVLGELASSGRQDIAAWLLDAPHKPADSNNPGLRLSERLNLITGIASTPSTRDFGYDWIHAHLDSLLSDRAGIFFAPTLPRVLASYCSTQRADQIGRDFGPRLKGGTAELELARAVERVRDCAVLKDRRGAEASAEIMRLR